ncbi:hypothetical protein FNQ90_09545 [Streptomyces alkaliphilus]|uniref:PLD phosphodiesterase domain-containing protein n=1 Tax=Streptomyces alkaliphilus TaxID=1472722 RepID=A0A7W3TCN4_9ACTN|nr:hypothetical protein [Streptomyces alkaliphilus]MBB0244342.1 hypothetical protein [Streptomyces alkaliphilus]
MSEVRHERFASPLTLLREWVERRDEQRLSEALFLGFTVDLPFLEKVALPLARASGARTAVIGDAARGLYDPVDVRRAGRDYLHGFAACAGAFHPKVALLIGDRACRLAVGSGNPTLSGWGANEELWTVLETEDDASHPLLADLADWLEELPTVVDMAPWSAGHLRELAGILTERYVAAPAGPESGPRLLHNLHQPLLEQLPPGPVDELHAYAPFVDPTGRALERIIGRLAPRRTILGLQPRWSGYDAEAIREALPDSSAGIRFLDETRLRHGKFLEWRIGDRRHSLTGSPNLTRAALCVSTARGGNCELAVLASDTEPLLPGEGDLVSPAELPGSTVRPVRTGPAAPVLLGAQTTGGRLTVALARGWPTPVGIASSPDGSPGSWTDIGEVPTGTEVHTFPDPGAPGAAIRASVRSGGAVLHSPVVFVHSPAHCARRPDLGDAPRLRHEYTVPELFTDEGAARRFEADIARLREWIAVITARPGRATALPAESGGAGETDRWETYLEECRRMIGTSLTEVAFDVSMIDLPQAPVARWTVSAITGQEDQEDQEDREEEPQEAEEALSVIGEPLVPYIPPDRRARFRAWTRRWVRALDSPSGPSGASDSASGATARAPLPVRLAVAGLCARLLAAGVWDEDDHGWRRDLEDLLLALSEGGAQDTEPSHPSVQERLNSVVAVVMTLLAQDVTLTGGGEHDVVAARAWHRCREMVAGARAGQVEDLMLDSERPLARVVRRSEVERLITLARDGNPGAELIEEFSAMGWSMRRGDGMWEIEGPFGNPLPVVGRAVSRLGAPPTGGVFVRARGRNGRWAFAAWDGSRLVLMNAPARVWRVHRVDPPATPESRFAGGDVSAIPGLIGRPTPLSAGPPETLSRMLAEVGLPYPELIGRLFALPSRGEAAGDDRAPGAGR